MTRFVLEITLLVVWANALVAAQQPSPPSKDSGLVLHVTTRMVLVDAVVVDKEGHPVTGLRAEDFLVIEDGVRQRIASFSERNSKLHLGGQNKYRLPVSAVRLSNAVKQPSLTSRVFCSGGAKRSSIPLRRASCTRWSRA